MENLGAMFKIVDALAMPLTAMQDGTLKGSKKGKFLFIDAKHVDFNMTVKGTVNNINHTGVLVHLMGDLYILLAVFMGSKALSLYVVDGNKVRRDEVRVAPEKLFVKQSALTDVVNSLGGAIVASFLRAENKQWKELSLSKKE